MKKVTSKTVRPRFRTEFEEWTFGECAKFAKIGFETMRQWARKELFTVYGDQRPPLVDAESFKKYLTTGRPS